MDWTTGLVIIVGIIALTAMVITWVSMPGTILEFKTQITNLESEVKIKDDYIKQLKETTRDQVAVWKERGDRLVASHDGMRDAQSELYKSLTDMVAKAGNHAGFKEAVGQLLPNGVPAGSGPIIDVK